MNGFVFVSLLGLLSGASALAETTTPPSLSQQTSVLGKVFGINYTTQANSAQNGMTLSLGATLLGRQTSLVQASIEPSANFADGQLQVYVGGTQISAITGAMEQAEWKDKVTFPPLNVNANIVSVPLWLFTIQVDGGYSLTGDLSTDIALNLSQGETTATTPSGVEASLGTTIAAAGFLQGSVSFLFLKGGLKGQLEAAEGAVQTKADLYFSKTPPTFKATGALGFFGGSVSAFADYFALFGWKEFWSATLFKWKGLCFNFDNGVKVNGTCPAQ